MFLKHPNLHVSEYMVTLMCRHPTAGAAAFEQVSSLPKGRADKSFMASKAKDILGMRNLLFFDFSHQGSATASTTESLEEGPHVLGPDWELSRDT